MAISSVTTVTKVRPCSSGDHCSALLSWSATLLFTGIVCFMTFAYAKVGVSDIAYRRPLVRRTPRNSGGREDIGIQEGECGHLPLRRLGVLLGDGLFEGRALLRDRASGSRHAQGAGGQEHGTLAGLRAELDWGWDLVCSAVDE